MANYKIRPEVTEHIPGMKVGGGESPAGGLAYKRGVIKLSDCYGSRLPEGGIGSLYVPANIFLAGVTDGTSGTAPYVCFSALNIFLYIGEPALGYLPEPWRDVLAPLVHIDSIATDAYLDGSLVLVPKGLLDECSTIAPIGFAERAGWLDGCELLTDVGGELSYVCPDLDYESIMLQALADQGASLMSLARPGR